MIGAAGGTFLGVCTFYKGIPMWLAPQAKKIGVFEPFIREFLCVGAAGKIFWGFCSILLGNSYIISAAGENFLEHFPPKHPENSTQFFGWFFFGWFFFPELRKCIPNFLMIFFGWFFFPENFVKTPFFFRWFFFDDFFFHEKWLSCDT